MNKESLNKVAYRLDLHSLHVEYLIALSEIEDQGEDVLQQLINIYREIAPKILCDAEVSIRESDHKATIERFQIFESASQRIGAQRLAELCRLLMRDTALKLPPNDLLRDLFYVREELGHVEHDLVLLSNLFETS